MKVNKRQLAEDVIGVTEETITQWMKQGCPVETQARGSKGNVYETKNVVAWLRAKAEERAETAEPGDMNWERARLLSAQADKTELEVAELHGEHVRVSDVTDAWSQHVASARARLLALPSKIAPRVSPPGLVAQTQELLRGIVDEALNELAGDGLPERTRSRLARAASLESPAKADGKPVGRRGKNAKPGVKRRAGKVEDGKG